MTNSLTPAQALREPDRYCLMKNKASFHTANFKDHFMYDNRPFINPEHGELDPIEWATVIDMSLINPNDCHSHYDTIPPDCYFQVTPNGEIRGVTHDYDEHQEYFSVTADQTDIVFLKLFLEQYPQHTPTLTSLLYYRKDRTSKWMAQVNQEK